MLMYSIYQFSVTYGVGYQRLGWRNCESKHAECQQQWAYRFEKANEVHKDLGCRGINAFQSSGLRSYRSAILTRIGQRRVPNMMGAVCMQFQVHLP